MRDPGAAWRSEDRAAELSLFRRHGRPAGKGEAGGPDGKFRAARFLGPHHRDLKEGGGGGLRRSDPLRQCRLKTAQPGQGRDGAVHGRSGAVLRRRPQDRGGVVIILPSPDDGRYWERTYPRSGTHGGGRRLKCVSAQEASKKYG